jgi:hypothetical protein
VPVITHTIKQNGKSFAKYQIIKLHNSQ